MTPVRAMAISYGLLSTVLLAGCGLVERLDSAPANGQEPDIPTVEDAAPPEDAPRAGRATAAGSSSSPPPSTPAGGSEATERSEPVTQDAPLGILQRYAQRDPAWPDSVGRLLARRFDAPERETVEGFLLYLPPGIEREEEDWPVILYLHGRSLRGNDLERVKRYGIPSFIRRGYQLPFIVVSPQLPAGQSWVDGERVWELLDEAVLDRYPVDRDRIYLTGFSMGAGGSWRVALANPDKFAAVLPIAATTPGRPEPWIEALGDDVPILYYHGDRDADVPYEPAADFVRALQVGGVDVELITLEGRDHNVVQQIYGDPEIYLWFLTHER